MYHNLIAISHWGKGLWYRYPNVFHKLPLSITVIFIHRLRSVPLSTTDPITYSLYVAGLYTLLAASMPKDALNSTHVSHCIGERRITLSRWHFHPPVKGPPPAVLHWTPFLSLCYCHCASSQLFSLLPLNGRHVRVFAVGFRWKSWERIWMSAASVGRLVGRWLVEPPWWQETGNVDGFLNDVANTDLSGESGSVGESGDRRVRG